jgi:hypothetical protein
MATDNEEEKIKNKIRKVDMAIDYCIGVGSTREKHKNNLNSLETVKDSLHRKLDNYHKSGR